MAQRVMRYDPDHPVFVHPPPETKIWRYMDFTKFVALLETQALFLAAADQLGDPFEGSVSAVTLALREQMFQEVADQATDREAALANLEMTTRMSAVHHKRQVGWTYISCWHASPGESAAMWAQYVPTGQGVAVQTTFERLEAVLPRDPGDIAGGLLVYAGLVEYLDYGATPVRDDNDFFRFMSKRKSFQHEQELRVLTQDWPFADTFDEDGVRALDPDKPHVAGISIPVDLDVLVAEVFLMPGTPSWIADLVQTQMTRAGLSAPVTTSELDADPLY
jgi:hypothetical protein